MSTFIADLHIHSCYSYDSLLEPAEIIIRAHQVGLQAIAITDHGTIEGALEAKELADNELGVQVIVGEEIGTDIGDVIGLNLTERIESGRRFNWIETLMKIRDQGGTTLLPHPYREHRRIAPEDAAIFDLIEVINGRCSHRQNAKALELAAFSFTQGVMGSDAHFYREIGTVRQNFDIDTMRPGFSGPFDFDRSVLWRKNVIGSRIIKFLKKRGMLKN